MVTPDDVLDTWFGGDPSEYREVWFKECPRFDVTCARFAEALREAKGGAFARWTDTPRGALALIILLDQISRNLHRGSSEAFAADPMAREVARVALARGFDRLLGPIERVFVYLPFEHSEDSADQDLSVDLFASLGGEMLRYAERHRDEIRRFGRFPYRNAALGRESTREELVYLAEVAAGF